MDAEGESLNKCSEFCVFCMPPSPLCQQTVIERGAAAQGGGKREMGHLVAVHIFDTVAATEIHAHQRVCYFAVLVAESGAPKPQLAVDNWADVTVKFLNYEKNVSEKGNFRDFILIFAMP